MTIIDVSRWQGTINWPKARAAGVTTAIMRATLGSTGKDDRFAANRIGSDAAGIPRRGIYHYVITGISGAAQVANILQATGGDFGNEPVTLDVERTTAEHASLAPFPKAAYTAMLKDMVDRLLLITPVRLYTSKNEWEAMTTLPAWALPLPHWLAHYNNFVTQPDRPAGWDWSLWQYTSTGTVDGIAGNVDMNKENGAAPPVIDPLPAAVAARAQAILGLVS